MSPPKKKNPVRKYAKKKPARNKQSYKSTPRVKKKSVNPDDSPKNIRIQKFLASAGVGSRRHCEEYIESGRVTVDGKVISDLGFSIDPLKQKIKLDGEYVRQQPKKYYLLHKPAGFLCTNKDPSGRPLAVELIRQESCRLFTVGRLDENSTGLIIVTNDGDLAHRLAHPKFQIPRQYRVQVVGRPTKEVLSQIQKGLYFSDGRFRVRGIKKIKTQGKSTFLELLLTEGQNREIRRMMARVGHKVISLQRVGFASIKLGRLPLGKSRLLKPPEIKSLISYIEAGEERLKSKPKYPKFKKTTPGKTTTSKSATSKSTTSKSTASKRTDENKSNDRRTSSQSSPMTRKTSKFTRKGVAKKNTVSFKKTSGVKKNSTKKNSTKKNSTKKNSTKKNSAKKKSTRNKSRKR